MHPEQLELLAEVQKAQGLTWSPGLVQRFAAEKPGASKSYGVKGNVSEAIQAAVKRGEIERVLFSEPSASLPDNFDSAIQWPAPGASSLQPVSDHLGMACLLSVSRSAPR